MSWAQQAEITERAFDRSRVARGEGEQVGRLVAMVVVAVLVALVVDRAAALSRSPCPPGRETCLGRWSVGHQLGNRRHGKFDGRHPERQRDRARRHAQGHLQDYARSIGVKKIDDLKKPELLAVVKDKVY